jgi:hypothetical protein
MIIVVAKKRPLTLIRRFGKNQFSFVGDHSHDVLRSGKFKTS